MSDEDEVLVLEGVEMTLSQLAELSYDETEEVTGFAKPPAGRYHMKISGMGVSLYQKELDDGEGTENRGIVYIDHEILGIVQLVKQQEHELAQAFIGDTYRESFFIDPDKPKDAWGRALAVLNASGFKGSGGWGQVYEQVVGWEYVPAIVRNRNPRDSDNPYANIDPKKTSPIQGSSTAAA